MGVGSVRVASSLTGWVAFLRKRWKKLGRGDDDVGIRVLPSPIDPANLPVVLFLIYLVAMFLF